MTLTRAREVHHVSHLVKASQAGWLAVAPELSLPALRGERLVHTPATSTHTTLLVACYVYGGGLLLVVVHTRAHML